ENLRIEVTGDHLACVIYTSGSMGMLKGVEITHAALANYVGQAAGIFGLSPADRVLQFASVSSDISVEEIFPCLMRGATLILRTNSMPDSAAGFLEKCRDWGISVLDLPTAYWHELTAALFSEHLAVPARIDRKSTRLNSSHLLISYAVFCLKKKKRRNSDMSEDIVMVVDDLYDFFALLLLLVGLIVFIAPFLPSVLVSSLC